MYDRTPYTPSLRDVIRLSKIEALRMGHTYIGPEHYLLGIICKDNCLAVQTLHNLEIDLEDLKMELERMPEVGKGADVNLFSPNSEAKNVLDTTRQIVRQMKHNWTGTEHLLLGLIKEEGTAAARCLRNFDVDFNKAQKEVLNVIDGSHSAAITETKPHSSPQQNDQ